MPVLDVDEAKFHQVFALGILALDNQEWKRMSVSLRRKCRTHNGLHYLVNHPSLGEAKYLYHRSRLNRGGIDTIWGNPKKLRVRGNYYLPYAFRCLLEADIGFGRFYAERKRTKRQGRRNLVPNLADLELFEDQPELVGGDDASIDPYELYGDPDNPNSNYVSPDYSEESSEEDY